MPPQVNLETLFTSCDDNEPPKNDVISVEYGHDNTPPESFFLSKDAEYEWFDRNAFFERKESTKGNNMPRSNSSNSQRFSVSLKNKASIIGLPKSQKATFADSKRRTCKTSSTSLFPKRSNSTGKSRGHLVEPGSPKVSCMGRVKSKRCRRMSNSLKRSEKTVQKSRSVREKQQQKSGLYAKVMNMFRSKKGQRKQGRSGSRKVREEMDEPGCTKKNMYVTVNPEPVGLGGMKRFVSGRRSESWTGEDFN